MEIPHWIYLGAIERDLAEISRYIEFDRRNWDCFSIELAKVLLAAGAEADVVAKQLCKAINPDSSADRIGKYRDEITEAYPKISEFSVLMPRFGLKLTPWDEWTNNNGVPFWWTAHNKVKHHRDSHYHEANLKNTLNAVAGLFVLVLYLYKDKASLGELRPRPLLLTLDYMHVVGQDSDAEYYSVY